MFQYFEILFGCTFIPGLTVVQCQKSTCVISVMDDIVQDRVLSSGI